MSKQTNWLLVLLVLAVLLSVAAFINQSSSLANEQASGANASARNAAIVATTEAVLKETSEIRELSILRPVKSGAQSRDAIERMLIRNLNEQTTEAEMHANQVAMRKLGLVPEDFDYRSFIIKLLTEQVAGYYDLKVREFYLADWLELEGQKPVMAHELTHALQDQHFNLKRFEKWPKEESDSELAVRALIEGDATLAMTIYMTKNPLEALAFTKSILSGSVSTEQINKAPRAMRESLIFPYLEGSQWATQLYKRGGWKSVSQAFAKLPLSTEQILHPEKYYAYEQPVKISLPDVSNMLNRSVASRQLSQDSTRSTSQSARAVYPRHLNATQIRRVEAPLPNPETFCLECLSPTPAVLLAAPVWLPSSYASARVAQVKRRKPSSRRIPAVGPSTPAPRPNPQPAKPSSWRRIDYDVHGEWGYYLILDEFLKSPADSKRAVAGWGGDRYALYEGPKSGDVFLAQLTTWDTEKDAREFFDAYVKRTQLRYPGAQPIDSESVSDKSEGVNKTLEVRNQTTAKSFRTSQGHVVIELRGSRVLIVEGAPGELNSKGLMATLWG